MDELTRLWQELLGRVSGPMSFRLVLQPSIAAIVAFRAALSDMRTGRPPYNWAVISDPVHRRELLVEGWKGVGKVFVLAMVLDLAYGFIVFRSVRPLETLIVAVVLACVPYFLIRGPVNRLIRARYAAKVKL